MIKINKLSSLFTFSYGTKLDLNKMKKMNKEDKDAVNFVSRTAKNLGVSATIKKIDDLEPHPSGLITVALGGSILSSFVQQDPFYTGQNIMVLTPIQPMTFQEKIYYCICIKKNDFRYSTFGREANRTLKELKVPKETPEWVNDDKLVNHLQTKLIKNIFVHNKD